MIFKTPCFVRVEDVEKRKELIDWCISLGYIRYNPDDGDYISVAGSHGVVSSPPEYLIGESKECRYDCGENIKLFKALAAMNDRNDYNQLFIDERDGSMNLSESQNIGLSALVYRKATTDEIVEYFSHP